MTETEYRCDFKSWCVRPEGHDGDCEPMALSRLYAPRSRTEADIVLAKPCVRCGAPVGVRCLGSLDRKYHFARFVLALLEPATEP